MVLHTYLFSYSKLIISWKLLILITTTLYRVFYPVYQCRPLTLLPKSYCIGMQLQMQLYKGNIFWLNTFGYCLIKPITKQLSGQHRCKQDVCRGGNKQCLQAVKLNLQSKQCCLLQLTYLVKSTSTGGSKTNTPSSSIGVGVFSK